jgi:Tol biopolymer transport system component
MPPGADFRLPAALVFLRDGQVWQLVPDATSLRQITAEAAPVTDLDVSPVDGALVYLTDNHLVHAAADGQHRRVLVAGPRLPPVDDDLAALNDKSHMGGRIAGPRWSPGGERIAYVQDGLNVMSLSSGQAETVFPNGRLPGKGEKLSEDPLLFERVLAWSPDGSHLLVQVYRYPLASIYSRSAAIKTLAGGLAIVGDCFPCDYVWSADSQHVYVASPSQGGDAALQRYALSRNQATLLALYEPARKAFFYAYPHPFNQDELGYFLGVAPDSGELPETFRLYRGPAHGSGAPTLLREERWSSIETALWAADGSGVLIVTASPSGEIEADALLWLPVDDGPIISLPVTGARTLRWGVDM